MYLEATRPQNLRSIYLGSTSSWKLSNSARHLDHPDCFADITFALFLDISVVFILSLETREISAGLLIIFHRRLHAVPSTYAHSLRNHAFSSPLSNAAQQAVWLLVKLAL